jgi:hypothetical protein
MRGTPRSELFYPTSDGEGAIRRRIAKLARTPSGWRGLILTSTDAAEPPQTSEALSDGTAAISDFSSSFLKTCFNTYWILLPLVTFLMQSEDDARFVVMYIHVAKSSAAAAIELLRAFHHTSCSSQMCHVACLQREGDQYLNQFVLFIIALDPSQLLLCTSSPAFASLTAAIDAVRVAPTIFKRFRSVVPSAPVNTRELLHYLSGNSTASFTVTHLDVIPSIPGNVERAHALLVHEVNAIQHSQQQQQQQQHAPNGIDGCFMFFGLQQTDRANHFTLVQVLLCAAVLAYEMKLMWRAMPCSALFCDATYQVPIYS